MLYRSTDRLCRCGAPMKNLAHSASFASDDNNAPLKSGIKHLGVLDTAAAAFTCGAKRTCKQMTSCEEATSYLTTCGARSLDGNGDGIACNGLCN